jgi:hypothetical protein
MKCQENRLGTGADRVLLRHTVCGQAANFRVETFHWLAESMA